MNLIRGNSIILYAILAMVEIAGIPVPGGAQVLVNGEFNLSREVRWGNSVLPMGDYEYYVDSSLSPFLVRVEKKGGGFSAVFIPQAFLRPGTQSSSGIFTAHIGNDSYVVSFQLQGLGGELEFSIPDALAGKEAASRIQAPDTNSSSSRALDYVTILNPKREKVSPDEVEKVYLRVCETIEKEFHRPKPVRPRLVLRLGASADVLRYPMGEIQLRKWDQYRFADGVLDLAMHSTLPPEERARLSDITVRAAAATVSVCELKACAN